MVTTHAKRLALEITGWVILVLGLAALVLPGPGLLLTFVGLFVLSTQYTWAKRFLEPVRVKAWRGAIESAETSFRIVVSLMGALIIGASGFLWLANPPAPGWWPLSDFWWLPGGQAAGITMLASSAIALGLLMFSVHRFYRKPAAIAEVNRMEMRYRARAARHKEARRRLARVRSRR